MGKVFTAEFPLQLPYQQKTGQMTVSIIGSDQDHQPADFTIGVSFNYTNTAENGVRFQGAPRIEATLVPSLLKNVENVESGGKTECQHDVGASLFFYSFFFLFLELTSFSLLLLRLSLLLSFQQTALRRTA